MSEVTRNSLEKILPQLKCHFTWNLFWEGSLSSHVEDRVRNQIDILNSEHKATMFNLLAYIKYLDGEKEAALECLRQAEVSVEPKQDDQAEIRHLVTWGNYAWIYYHMGRLSEAQAYVDKVRHVCEKYANPYSVECPELDCEEGWTRLKCGRNERAKMCFLKALEEKPSDPECSSGLAIATSRLEEQPEKQFAVDALKQAMELNAENQYVKVLLALKLQKMGEEAEGERLIDDALRKAPDQADVLQKASQFYQKKGNLDRANTLLVRALRSTENKTPLYSLVMCRYRERLKQLQKTGNAGSSDSLEKMEELRQLTMEYMRQALQRKQSRLNSYSDLIDYPEVKRCCQLVFGKESPSAEEQQLYQSYCNLQEYHQRSEGLAALKELLKSCSLTETASIEKEGMKEQA
ncbi:interferon-induced protein with tetratricopeptide repeats 3-like isoform X3 [Cricetulus griseus]|uniref:Interferon-induced protein with tetratricopeptide repeats 3-like isoform X3 n=2 Tax=Cricetulus griseus TaxID=10029 RepID=A0A9J7JJ26_CRIGR|nr:interferon-induced protein with tetratricopeptide repeats 3-like isoform X3 [Cricetulus griseus]